jgi:hypothetical protein
MDENGVPAYFEVFAEDVTEKRVLEKQLRPSGLQDWKVRDVRGD